MLTEDKGQEKILWRAPGKSSWEVIAAYRSTEAPFVPRFVDANARLFVAVPEGPARTAAIRRFDFATGKPEAESLVRAPGFDFAGSFIVGDDDARWRGVRVDTDAESTVWFEPRMKEI